MTSPAASAVSKEKSLIFSDHWSTLFVTTTLDSPRSHAYEIVKRGLGSAGAEPQICPRPLLTTSGSCQSLEDVSPSLQ